MATHKKSKEERMQEAEEIANGAMKRYRNKQKEQGETTSDSVPGDGMAKQAGSAIERRQKRRRDLLNM